MTPELHFVLGDRVKLITGDQGRITGYVRTPMGMMLQIQLDVPNRWGQLETTAWESTTVKLKE